MLNVLPNTLRFLIAAFLWPTSDRDAGSPITFQLRHQHAVTNESRIVFSDVPQSFTADTYYRISTTKVKAFRPESSTAFANARMRSMRQMQTEPLNWWDTDVPGPDVTKRENLLLLANMTHNSYYDVGEKGWYDLGSGWNTVRTRVSASALLY
jgi:putative lipase involved disintegration of autophagic bodies